MQDAVNAHFRQLGLVTLLYAIAMAVQVWLGLRTARALMEEEGGSGEGGLPAGKEHQSSARRYDD